MEHAARLDADERRCVVSDFAAFTLLTLYLAHVALLTQRLDTLAALAAMMRRLEAGRRAMDNDMSQNGEER
jgi:hypothetical protein